ncbi:hypothetical protein G5714_013111 [Onychostoma macrolepis]|uniref:BRCT domain-containing protein n=1 Tax=Onychostoma macrolepis TaxID=369639 RepID=A0A7J6CDR8_9TELE|nr:hypothetical protein G5714_013111 [Onychostoma macrolepis]
MTGKNTSTGFLKDVVAYVDVWSASRMEDYSDPFIQQLQDMGAEVSKTLNKQVTHVVFKHGRPSTWKKAQKMGVRIVSVHWVARCKEGNERVDENLFPAQNEESKLLHHLNKRTHRCMQPRDIPIKTPENDRRLKKKLDKMMEGLISSSPVVSDTSPFVIDEENGVVYSPSLKRSDSMAQRLREMRAQREHLSPTASQMLDSASGCNSPLRPPFGASPTLSFLQQLEEEPLDCFSASQYHSSKKRDEQEKQNCPAPETHEPRPECVSVGTCELPRKKQISSIELSPANEKKTSTATSPVSSSAVNVNLQMQNFPETAPDPKHAIEKRQMGLKIVGKENESTTDGSIERSPEMSSKPRHMKKDKFMKKNRSLVMTSMPTEKQEVVFQLVRNLGGFTVVDNVCESTTHVVSGSPRRTLNILLGIARGCWILSFEWILWCLEHRQWVPEEPYELSDHFPAAPICRLQQHLSAGEHQQDLFQHQRPMFVSPHSQPPCNSLTELIQLCGGTVCRSVRQAGIFIGQYNGKKTEGSCSLSEQWILDCVTHLTLLPYENYVLE